MNSKVLRRLKAGIDVGLRSIGYRLDRISRAPHQSASPPAEIALFARLLSCESIRIVQVGANDGIHGDPLRDFFNVAGNRVKALLIEPHPDAFNRLSATYGNDGRITLVNAAVTAGGPLRLWTLAENLRTEYEAAYGRPVDIITSTDKQHVVSRVAKRLRISLADAQAVVVPLQVQSCTLNDILRQSSFGTEIDLLQVDTEGYDDSLLMSLDFAVLTVRMINYESFLLSRRRANSLNEFLDSSGYVQRPAGPDRLAFRVGQAL